jgi:hypothetical protein
VSANRARHDEQGGGEAGQIRFLRQIVDCGAGLGEAISRIGLHQPGRNAQQGGLAPAVAPDQADSIAGRDGQLRASKQRRNSKGDTDVLQQKTPKVTLMSCSRSNGGGIADEISRDGPCQ